MQLDDKLNYQNTVLQIGFGLQNKLGCQIQGASAHKVQRRQKLSLLPDKHLFLSLRKPVISVFIFLIQGRQFGRSYARKGKLQLMTLPATDRA